MGRLTYWELMRGRRELVRGFTLVELLVVIAVMSILVALGFSSFTTARVKARDATRKSDLYNIRATLEIFYTDLGLYPASSVSNQIMGGGNPCTEVAAWGDDWSCGSPAVSYLSPLPEDPSSGQDYRYLQISDDQYYLEACLENANDQQGRDPDSDSQTGFTSANCPSDNIFQLSNP